MGTPWVSGGMVFKWAVIVGCIGTIHAMLQLKIVTHESAHMRTSAERIAVSFYKTLPTVSLPSFWILLRIFLLT